MHLGHSGLALGGALLLLLLLPTTARVASARELQGRLGLGYNAQFANAAATNGVPGLSAKYALERDLAAEAIFGAALGGTPSNMVIGMKVFKNLFLETNLNFYFLAGGGYLSANSNTGFQFLTGFGTEFFFPGLESLGLSMELGASMDNLTGSFITKTMGVSFLNAGMRFYF